MTHLFFRPHFLNITLTRRRNHISHPIKGELAASPASLTAPSHPAAFVLASDCWLLAAVCWLLCVGGWLVAATCPMQSAACCLLPASRYLLPAAGGCCLLPTARGLRPVSSCPRPGRLLPPPTSHNSPHRLVFLRSPEHISGSEYGPCFLKRYIWLYSKGCFSSLFVLCLTGASPISPLHPGDNSQPPTTSSPRRPPLALHTEHVREDSFG